MRNNNKIIIYIIIFTPQFFKDNYVEMYIDDTNTRCIIMPTLGCWLPKSGTYFPL